MRIATGGTWLKSRCDRLSGRLVIAVLGAILALCVRMTVAEAHDAAFKDLPRVSCTGLLTGTVVSWVGLPNDPAQPEVHDQSRTNPWITVWYSPDGGDYIRLHQTYELSPRDKFSFRFSVQLLSPLPHTVKVEVLPEAQWADGGPPGPPLFSNTATVPPPCPPVTATPAPSAIPLLNGLTRTPLPAVVVAALGIGVFGALVIAALAALRGGGPVRLDRVDSKAANLRGARFERANLRGAHFERANLRGAHLEEAILLDTHLEGANLREALLDRAILRGAHLQGTDLMGAQGLTHEQLLEAVLDNQTKLPSYLMEGRS